jgi:hypothetical protein
MVGGGGSSFDPLFWVFHSLFALLVKKLVKKLPAICQQISIFSTLHEDYRLIFSRSQRIRGQY